MVHFEAPVNNLRVTCHSNSINDSKNLHLVMVVVPLLEEQVLLLSLLLSSSSLPSLLLLLPMVSLSC